VSKWTRVTTFGTCVAFVEKSYTRAWPLPTGGVSFVLVQDGLVHGRPRKNVGRLGLYVTDGSSCSLARYKSRAFTRNTLPSYTLALLGLEECIIMTRTLQHASKGKLQPAMDERGPFPIYDRWCLSRLSSPRESSMWWTNRRRIFEDD